MPWTAIGPTRSAPAALGRKASTPRARTVAPPGRPLRTTPPAGPSGTTGPARNRCRRQRSAADRPGLGSPTGPSRRRAAIHRPTTSSAPRRPTAPLPSRHRDVPLASERHPYVRSPAPGGTDTADARGSPRAAADRSSRSGPAVGNCDPPPYAGRKGRRRSAGCGLGLDTRAKATQPVSAPARRRSPQARQACRGDGPIANRSHLDVAACDASSSSTSRRLCPRRPQSAPLRISSVGNGAFACVMLPMAFDRRLRAGLSGGAYMEVPRRPVAHADAALPFRSPPAIDDGGLSVDRAGHSSRIARPAAVVPHFSTACRCRVGPLGAMAPIATTRRDGGAFVTADIPVTTSAAFPPFPAQARLAGGTTAEG